MINSQAESMINICISGPHIVCHVTQSMTTKDIATFFVCCIQHCVLSYKT